MAWGRWIDAFRAQSRAILRRQRDRDDVRDELEFHIAMQAHANRERGMNETEASRRARIAFGGLAQTNELARDVRPLQWLGRLARDMRYTTRSLRRAKGFTIVALLTIGLAIGACTAMYSVVYGVVLQPLPYPGPDRLVHIWQINQGDRSSQFSDPNFRDLEATASSFAAVAEYSQGSAPAMIGAEPIRVDAAAVSRDFFNVFVTEPAIGRRFVETDLLEGAPPAVIVSDRFWQQRLGAPRDLSNVALRFRGVPAVVVGVMPSGFAFPAGADIWVPRELTAPSPARTGHNWRVVARLKDGISIEAARAETTTLAQRWKAEHGESTWMVGMRIVPLHEELVGRVRPVLMLLLGAVGLLLIVATANLANLLLLRTVGRQRELAVRRALGAAGLSLMMPVAMESLVISAAGGLVGLSIAYAVVEVLASGALVSVPRLDEVRLSRSVMGFAFAVTSVTAFVLSGLIAWRARRPDLVEWLKDGQRGHTGGQALRRLRNSVVIIQLAVSVVLLIGAGLLGRSLARLLSQDLGFRIERVLTVQTAMPRPDIRFTSSGLEFSDPTALPRQTRLVERMIERLGALPGVEHAGGINALPLGGGYSNGRYITVSDARRPRDFDELSSSFNDPSRTGEAQFRVASGGYFSAMGIPLVRGRVFADEDTAGRAPHSAVISEALARKQWPNEDPIGRYVQFGGMDGDLTPFVIVGIVGDIRETGFDAQPQPTFYADYRQRQAWVFNFSVVLQTAVPPSTVIEDARRVLREMAPEMPPRFRTIEDAIAGTTATRRFVAGLTISFAGAAMMLALLGIYGVLSYLVQQRRQEFGVRIALGARPSDVRRLVLREVAWLVGIGLPLGIGASLALAGTLDRMVFGITPTDATTYAGVVVGLGLAALAAGQWPAFRATRIDPVKALHES